MTNSPNAKDATVIDLIKPSLPYAAAAWVLLLLATVIIAWRLPSLAPLASWILLGLASVLVTVLFYLLTFPIQKSISIFQTTTGKVTLQLVGPVVVFAGLLYFGKGYIQAEPFVELSGSVTDKDGNAVTGALVTVMRDGDKIRTDDDGKFSLRVPMAPNRLYDITVTKDAAYPREFPEQYIDDTGNIIIDDFPPSETIISVRDLKNENEEPIDNIQVFFEAVTEPRIGYYRADRGYVDLELTPDKYYFVVKKDGEEKFREKVDITTGNFSPLTKTIPEEKLQ